MDIWEVLHWNSVVCNKNINPKLSEIESIIKRIPRGQGKWFFYCPFGILDFQELNICCCSYTHFFSFCTIVACKPRIRT